MQKNKFTVIFIMLCTIFSSCLSYPTTTFWVENESNHKVSFTATAFHYRMGTMTLPFVVPPHQKVLLRQIGLSEKGTIKDVFQSIDLIKHDSLLWIDPMNPENWIQAKDSLGKNILTFKIK